MKVRDVMTKNPVTISPDDTINNAFEMMNKNHVWTLPVVSEGKLIGVLTKQDIKHRMKDPSQKVSEIMSTPAFTISPEEELSVATEKLSSLRINALTIVEGMNIVGILTRSDIHKKSLFKIGECYYCYPRGDKEEKEITLCNYCNNWFCTDHFIPKKPMAAPFKSTETDERTEWEKKGHPCVPYYDVIREQEKYLSKESYQSYGKGVIKIEPPSFPKPEPAPSFPEPEPPTIPLPKPSSGGGIKPKNKEPVGLPYKIVSGLLIVLLAISIVYCSTAAMEINSRSSYLETVKDNLNDVSNELKEATAKLNSNESVLRSLENRLNSVNNQLSTTEFNLNNVDSELAYLRTGGRFNLHDPTYSEVISFLARDRTDSNTYSSSSYTCTYFSKDVNNNAEKQGIICAYVEVDFPSIGHAVVGFNTTDGGLVYFEPQHDVRAKLVIGKRYYQCLENIPGYLPWTAPDYDDTIKEIICYW